MTNRQQIKKIFKEAGLSNNLIKLYFSKGIRYDVSKDRRPTMKYILARSFTWYTTDEGDIFWRDVANGRRKDV